MERFWSDVKEGIVLTSYNYLSEVQNTKHAILSVVVYVFSSINVDPLFILFTGQYGSGHCCKWRYWVLCNFTYFTFMNLLTFFRPCSVARGLEAIEGV
jgi:hypothetical protein